MSIQQSSVLRLAETIKNHTVYVDDFNKFYNKHVKDNNVLEMVIDTETTGLDYFNFAKVFAIGVGIHVNDKFYIYAHDLQTEPALPTKLRDMLFNKKIRKIGHNIKFDIQMLRHSSVPIVGEFEDTLLLSRLCISGLESYSLKVVSKYLTGGLYADDYEQPLKDWLRRAKGDSSRGGNAPDTVNYADVPWHILVNYLRLDILSTFICWKVLSSLCKFNELRGAYEIDKAALKVAIDIENRGLFVSLHQTHLLDTKLSKEIVKQTVKIKKIIHENYGVANFNIRSVKQMKELLLNKLCIDIEDLQKDGKFCTEKDVLEIANEKYKFKLIDLILDTKVKQKMISTYIRPIEQRTDHLSALHCQFFIDTKTGRFSSREPNLQNIPRVGQEVHGDEIENPIRKLFVPRHGYDVYHFDYSQIEMRWFAYYCEEPTMLNALALGQDLHDFTTEMLFGEVTPANRQKAKSLNFGFLYGMGKKKLALKMKVTPAEADALYKKYYEAFPGLLVLQRKLKRDIYNNGYITDYFGRRYYIDLEHAYKAVNALIQGVSANILKIGMHELSKLILNFNSTVNTMMPKVYLINVIHDEFVIEIPTLYTKDTTNELLLAIKNKLEYLVPIPSDKLCLKVDIKKETDSWANKIKVDLTN